MITTRELGKDEYRRAETELWTHDHGQKTNPLTDRIFGAFMGRRLVGAVRVKRHADAFVVDSIYVRKSCHGRGIAKRLMRRIVDEMGDRLLWMYSRGDTASRCRTWGFHPVSEGDLPPVLRQRLAPVPGSRFTPMVRLPEDSRRVVHPTPSLPLREVTSAPKGPLVVRRIRLS